jgi:DNA-binding beta-propeller fold protein YncE
MTRLGVELLAYIDESKGDVSFQPSGIAVHPVTGNIYIIAAVGNLVLIYSRSGDILAMIKIESKYHKQPEGICFEPDGTLYIANEGDDDKGTILQFKMKTKNLE